MPTPTIPPPPPPTGQKRVTRRPGSGKKARRAVLTGLTCASCGGSVDVAEGRTNVACRYCGTGQAVVGARGIARVMVLNTLDRSHAGRVVRRWFKRGITKEPRLKKEATLQEAFLAWFPFVRLRLDVVGWILGIKQRKRKRGNRWETVKTPVETMVEEPVDLTMPAAEMAEFGVHRINLAGDEVLPLDEGVLRSRGMVFRPSRSLDEIADRLADQAVQRAGERQRPDHVSYSWLAAVRRRTALVYYPLWVIRYGFRGRTYQVLVDAEDGSLAYGKAPGNHLWRAFCLVASCAGASFVGTTFLQHADIVLRSDDGFKALIMVGLVLAGLVYWGFRQFRHGGVVEEGSGLASKTGSEDDLEATVKRFIGRLE